MEVHFIKEGKMIKKIIITATIIGVITTGYNYQTKHLSAISPKGSSCSSKDDPVNNGSALLGGGSKK